MASRYAVGASFTWDLSTTTHWAATDGGAGGQSAPTATDDVFFTANSPAAITVSSGITAVCQSLTTTGWTGTIAAGGVTTALSIGSASGGALTLAAGTTITTTNFTWNFVATSTNGGVGWGITTAGKVLPVLSFNGAGGRWQMLDNFRWSAGGSGNANLVAGTIDFNAKTITGWTFTSSGATTRALILTNATFNLSASTLAWSVSGSNCTVTAGGETFNLQANSDASTFGGAGFTHIATPTVSTFNAINILPSTGVSAGTTPVITVSTTTTITSLTYTGAAANKAYNLQFPQNTIIGTLTVNGANASTQRILISSGAASQVGNSRTLTVTTNALTSVDFMDIAGAGGANWDLHAITGGAGDCGGNSGITFTTPATQTCTMSTSQSWSTLAIWTSRVPLPQDNVLLSGVTGGTLTGDMPRLGASIDWTGATGSPTWTTNLSVTSFGSLKLISGMSLGSPGNTYTFGGRGSFTITTATKTFTLGSLVFAAPTGTYFFGDTFSSSTNGMNLNEGTLDSATNGVNVTCGYYAGSGTLNAKTLNIANTTWNITSNTGGFFWASGGATETLLSSGSTIAITTASASARIFSGQGKQYNILNYTVAGSTGALQFQPAQTVNITTLNASDASNARALIFAHGQTFNIPNFNVNGNGTQNATLSSDSAGVQYTLNNPSTNVNNCKGLTIQDSNATGGAGWFAYSGSVNTSNNTGWVFSAFGTITKSRIAITSTATTNTKSRVASAITSTTTSKSRVINTLSATSATLSRIAKVFTGTSATKSRVAISANATQPTKSRVQRALAATSTTLSRIAHAFSATQTTTSRVQIHSSATSSTLSRVQISSTSTLTTRSRVAAPFAMATMTVSRIKLASPGQSAVTAQDLVTSAVASSDLVTSGISTLP